MSLEKSILSGFEHRKLYKHCICYYCINNRKYKNIKRTQSLNEKLKDYKKGE